MEILILANGFLANSLCNGDSFNDCNYCMCDCDNCGCDNKEGCMGDGYVPNGECIIGA